MVYVFYGACIALALWIAHAAYKVLLYPYLSPYRHLPSPEQGPFWKRFFVEPNTFDFLEWAKEVPNDGLIRYFGMFNDERLHVTSTEGVYQFLQKDAYSYVKPSAQRQLVRFLAGDNIVINEGSAHKITRKGLQPAFSPARKEVWYNLFSSMAKELVETINRQLPLSPSEAAPINLSRLLSQTGLDTIGRACVGADLDSLSSPKEHPTLGYLKLFNTSANAKLLEIAMHIIPFWMLESLPLKPVQYARDVTRRIRGIVQHNVEEQVCAQDLDENHDTKDSKPMIDVVRQDLLTPSQIINNALTFVTAGHEEIGTGLTWVIFFLIQYPEVQDRLRSKIRTALSGSPSWKEDGFTEDDLNRIPYLRAVINESLRLRPNVPIIWRQSTTPSTLVGTQLKHSRTVVTASTWALNRNEDEWGSDAAKFRPERWLEDVNGGAKSAFSFMTFGQGPRKCIGELYARTQMECMLCGLIDSFKLSNGHGDNEIVADQGMITVKVWQGLRVYAEPAGPSS